jgi:hypothetical protein
MFTDVPEERSGYFLPEKVRPPNASYNDIHLMGVFRAEERSNAFLRNVCKHLLFYMPDNSSVRASLLAI